MITIMIITISIIKALEKNSFSKKLKKVEIG